MARARIERIDLDRTRQQAPCFLVVPPAGAVQQADGAHDETPCIDALWGASGGAQAFLGIEVRLDSCNDARRDLVLHCEDVVQVAVVALGPDVLA
jgi:hypothetical protein